MKLQDGPENDGYKLQDMKSQGIKEQDMKLAQKRQTFEAE